jgi:hypothetical protein
MKKTVARVDWARLRKARVDGSALAHSFSFLPGKVLLPPSQSDEHQLPSSPPRRTEQAMTPAET